MAKFNNLIDLKQEVRLHIIQRDTRLFKQYLEMDEALANNDDIAKHFNDKKTQILKHVERISDYEQRKQQALDKIYKKYVADSK